MPISSDQPPKSFILTVQCPDRIGIVAAVSNFLSENNAFISQSDHYGDPDTKSFFMRTVFHSNSNAELKFETFSTGLDKMSKAFDMKCDVYDSEKKVKAIIAVSQSGHCLNHLLHRVENNTMPLEVKGVVSNHEKLKDLVEWHKIPFYFLPIDSNKKQDQEEKILKIMHDNECELLVLARYMQILTENTCKILNGRIINIHHSFLPSFKGAKPYHQAHSRGVKIIGATAHYVTPELDEGPIIDQAIENINHTLSPSEIINIGRDIECIVLSRAVSLHAQRKVFMNNKKTVVFG